MTQALKILLMVNVARVSKCATALNQMKNYPQDKRRSEVSAFEPALTGLPDTSPKTF